MHQLVLGIILLVGAVILGVDGGNLLIVVSEEGSSTFFVVVGEDSCRDLLVVGGKDGVKLLVIVGEDGVGGLLVEGKPLIIVSEGGDGVELLLVGGDGDKLLVEGVGGDKLLVIGGEDVCGKGSSCELDPVGGECSSELLIMVSKVGVCELVIVVDKCTWNFPGSADL
jgi:hypothetical protein